MRTTWSREFPPEVRELLEPLLDFWAFLIPAWCRHLGIVYTNSEDDSACSMQAKPEYRQATLHIHGGWLSERPLDREWGLTHELCHLVLAPVYSLPEALIAVNSDQSTKAVLNAQWIEAVEAAVCDMAESWMSFVYGDTLEVEDG